jgi:L-fuconolactonase
MATSLRVDAHHHVWDLTRRDQEWTIGSPVLHRSFSMDELVPQLRDNGIGATVVVQTVNVSAETPELLTLALACEWVAGVVGWADLRAVDVRERLDELRDSPGGTHLVGIRHVVQSEPDPNWLVHPESLRGLAHVGRAGLAYDVLVRPHQLPSVITAARTLPDVRFILDHAGKPPIADGRLGEWKQHVIDLSRCDNVAIKLSGLVTEARQESWQVADLRPFSDAVLESFGPRRTMFGSDWPTCQTAGTYREVVEAARELTSELSPDESDDVFCRTAVDWYGLQIS